MLRTMYKCLRVIRISRVGVMKKVIFVIAISLPQFSSATSLWIKFMDTELSRQEALRKERKDTCIKSTFELATKVINESCLEGSPLSAGPVHECFKDRENKVLQLKTDGHFDKYCSAG